MTYCSRCGNQAKEGAQFCDRCGSPLSGAFQQPYQSPPPSYTYAPRPDRKDPLIAVILSLLLPGIGQIYVGRVLRGLLIFLLMPAIGLAPALSLFAIVSFESFGGFVILATLLSIIALALYVWQIYDAYRLAEEHNGQGVRRY